MIFDEFVYLVIDYFKLTENVHVFEHTCFHDEIFNAACEALHSKCRDLMYLTVSKELKDERDCFQVFYYCSFMTLMIVRSMFNE